jgi:hypothetical protein
MRGKLSIQKERGSALFTAIMFSFIGLLIIAGLVAVWYRLTHILFPVKTYTSVREASAGGIKLLASYVDQGYFSELEKGNCPPGTSPTANGTCCLVNLKYKLLGESKEYINPITICLLGYQPQPGFEITGVAYTSQAARLGLNYIYGFNSTAYGPNNVTAYVEAVYIK